MSELGRRLARVSEGLSARERVLLILRADAEGLPEDPAWRRMPDFQSAEFNHFIRQANGVNHVLVPHATVLLCEVETLEARWQLLTAHVAWAAERALRPAKRRKVQPTDLSPPWSVLPALAGGGGLLEDGALTTADRHMRSLAEGIAQALTRCWSRLLALEQVRDDVVREFQDEVAIPAVLREYLQVVRAKLERLDEQAPRFIGVLERPEADEATLAMLQRGFEAQRQQ